eukprot:7173396-Ditylum_brightwellii.AAC.1
MQQCSEHVDFQLPNQLTRVKYLVDGIECGDASLQASMDLVKNDDQSTGKMNNFEAAASFILPSDPVEKKSQSGTKRNNAEISPASGKAGGGKQKK